MDRDVSGIANQPCNVLVDNQTIATYSGFQVNEYKYISNKYYLFETRDYSGMPTTLNCMTTEEIQHIPSQFDFITPVYHLMAIISVLFIFWFAYRLLIYPFFRKRG